MQAGNTATTTTVRQSLTEGDSPSIFSHSSTMQAGNTATTMTVCQSLTGRGGVIVQTDGNTDTAEHSGSLPSSSTKITF